MAFLYYNEWTAEMVAKHFEKHQIMKLSEIPLVPAESISHSTARIVFGVVKSFTVVALTDVTKSGLTPHEAVIFALLMKKIGIKHAFTVVMTGIL